MGWKFRSGAQWREVPPEFGVWQTVYDRFVRWRDAGVFLALMGGMIAEAAQRGQAHTRGCGQVRRVAGGVCAKRLLGELVENAGPLHPRP